MSANKYTIVQKDIKGIEIRGYIIESEEGTRKNISLADTIKLARSEKISNAKAIFDAGSGHYMLDIDNGLESIEDADRTRGLKFSVIGRMLNSEDVCVGYKVQDTKGKIYKLSISKIWELAEQGSIVGIVAKIKAGKKVLVSTDDCQLHSIPIIRN